MKKRLVALLIATSVMASTLAGCGAAETGKESTAAKESETTEVASSAEKETPEQPEETPVIKILLHCGDTVNMMDPDDMDIITAIDQQVGVETEWEVIKEANWSTQINLILADKKDWPDVIISPAKMDSEKYGVDQGMFLALDDLIAEYMPNYSKQIAESAVDPTIKNIASDGKHYAVGYFVPQNVNTGVQYFVNKTWMEALKLETPTNVEELTEVLRAFKTGDPNGNGQADEIPMSGTVTKGGTDSLFYMLGLFGIPYANYDWLWVNDNKQVQLVPKSDGFRECMEWLHECYVEGLLDVECLSQDTKTVNSKAGEGRIGFGTTSRLNSSPWGAAALDYYTLYVPGEGAKYNKTIESAGDRVNILSSNENVEATMKWLDACFDVETQFTLYYGEKQETMDTSKPGWYYNANGNIEQVAVDKDKAPALLPYLGATGLFMMSPTNYADVFEMPIYRTEKTENAKLYEDAGVFQKYSNSWTGYVKLTNEQSQEVALVKTELESAMLEHVAKFIDEGVTDDSWNEFMGVLDNLKLEDRYVDVMNEGMAKLDIK